MIFSSTLSNGTYYYEIILSSSIFRLTPSVSYFQINCHNTTLSLSYGNAPKVTYYNASFREKGLPSDYLFTVSIYQYAYYDQLATNSTVISSWVSVSFSLPNGTYYFQGSYSAISGTGYYVSSDNEGSITVNGTHLNMSISYQQERFLIIKIGPSAVNTANLHYSAEIVNLTNGGNQCIFVKFTRKFPLNFPRKLLLLYHSQWRQLQA